MFSALPPINVLILVLATASLIPSCDSSGVLQKALGSDPECEVFRHTLCNSLDYNTTTFPNFRGHKTLQMAAMVMNKSIGLIQTGCSGAVVHLLCSVYFPYCNVNVQDGSLIRLHPCKSLCEEVRFNCETTMKQLGWREMPYYLDCDGALDDNGGKLYRERSLDHPYCFGPPDPSQLVVPSIPGIKVRVVDSEDYAPPNIPLNLAMKVEGSRTITLGWNCPQLANTDPAQHLTDGTAPVDNTPTDYIISCSPQPLEFPYQVRAGVNGTISASVRITLDKFQPDTTYSCEVRAYNGAGAGHQAIATATTPKLLTLTYTKNTPTVTASNGRIKVLFTLSRHANRVFCQLREFKRSRLNCSSGRAVFMNIPTGTYTLKVTAINRKHDRLTDKRMVSVVRQEEKMCAVNLINSPTYTAGETVRLEVEGVGPVQGYTCSIAVGNRKTRPKPCSPSPALRFTFTSYGEHEITISPFGGQCTQTKSLKYKVTM